MKRLDSRIDGSWDFMVHKPCKAPKRPLGKTSVAYALASALVAIILVFQADAIAVGTDLDAVSPPNPAGFGMAQASKPSSAYAAVPSLEQASEAGGDQGGAYGSYELSAEDQRLLSGLRKREIVIGYVTELSYYFDEQNHESGVLMPVVHLLRSWGLNVELKKVEQIDSFENWKDGDIDIYSSVTLTHDLVQRYACTGCIYDTRILSITPKDKVMEDFSSISGKSIGVLQETGIQEAISLYSAQGEDVKVYSSIDDLLNGVETGEVEVACTSLTMQSDVAGRTDLSYRAMNGVAPFDKGLVAPKEDMRPLIELIDRVLQSDTGVQLKADTEAEIEVSLIEQLRITLGDEIAALSHAYDTITVLGSKNIYPFCFEQNGRLEGILPETMELFTDVTGIPVDYTTHESFEDEAALTAAINQGEIQVVAGVYKFSLPEQFGSYSIPLCEDTVMLYKLANSDFENHEASDLRIGVARDLYPYIEGQMFFGEEPPASYHDEQAVLEALDRGEVDLALVSTMCVDYCSVIEGRFDYERFDNTEISADVYLNYSQTNAEELNDVIDGVAALYNASYSYQIDDWDKQVLDYQQEYIRSVSERRATTLAFGVLLMGLVVLLLGASLLSYRQYRKYSEYDRRIRMLVGNQNMMDIGFGDLKQGTLTSKGDWPILRKIGVDVPHSETLTFAEIYHRSGVNLLQDYQALVDDLKTRGETMAINEVEFEYEDLRVYVSQSIYLLSDDTFAFYEIDITSSKEETAMLKELAELDNLTKAYRRKAFTDRAEQLRAEESGSLYLTIADIDFFKRVNDSYGHEIGDQVICRVVARMKEMFAVPGCVGRWGGEEFVAVFYADSKEDAIQKVEAYLRAIEQESIVIDQASGKSLGVTVSAGVTEWTKEGSLRFALSEADTALYVSKKSGRNRVSFFEP